MYPYENEKICNHGKEWNLCFDNELKDGCIHNVMQRNKLYRYFSILGFQDVDILDILQELSIKLTEDILKKYQNGNIANSKLESYIFKTAKNLGLAAIKKRQQQEKRKKIQETAKFDEMQKENIFYEELKECLEEIEPKIKHVIMLQVGLISPEKIEREWNSQERISQEDIAKELGIDVRTVSKYRLNGERFLYQCLEKKGIEVPHVRDFLARLRILFSIENLEEIQDWNQKIQEFPQSLNILQKIKKLINREFKYKEDYPISLELLKKIENSIAEYEKKSLGEKI